MIHANNLQTRVSPQFQLVKQAFSKVRVRFGTAKRDPLLLELPQHLDLMAAKMAAGMSFYAVLTDQLNGSQGRFSALTRRLSLRLQYGDSLEVALKALAIEAKSDAVSEFVTKVEIGLIRGTPLAEQLALLAEATRARLRVQLLRQAGKNELLMLVPLVFLILPTTIAFAVYPSLQLLQSGL